MKTEILLTSFLKINKENVDHLNKCFNKIKLPLLILCERTEEAML